MTEPGTDLATPLLKHPETGILAPGSLGRRRLSFYSGVTLNVARPDMNNYATLGVMLYKGIGGSKDQGDIKILPLGRCFGDLARRAILGFVLY